MGNPNSGKTTLFNKLTGSNQHVGNWPGVTVDRKTGQIHHAGKTIDVVDLPGIYSLSPYTQEEIIAREFVLSDELDGILNIVDARQHRAESLSDHAAYFSGASHGDCAELYR